MHFAPEIWVPIVLALAVQLIGYGAIRQQVKNLADSVAEEKLELKKVDERVRNVEIFLGPVLSQNLSMSKKAGG